jgi:phospholipid/cholesterol/gamma-HCH transport system substrate-binding protein
MWRRTAVAAMTTMAIGAALTGCSYTGLNSFELPGAQGEGAGSYDVQLEMANVGDLVPNNPVRVNDVNIGTIRSIALDGWHALVTVSLDSGVTLPENISARVGQVSLLGAKYIELDRPASGQESGVLKPGMRLGIAQTGKYTETEDLLASIAMLLNGGGLSNLKTITYELNQTFAGRAPQFRDLLTQLNTFVSGLDKQKADILRAIDGLDRLSTNFAQYDPQINAALVSLPPALAVLNKQQQNLTNTLSSLSTFGDTTDDVVSRGGQDLATNIDNLGPALKGLADAGQSLTNSLDMLGTVIFPLRSFGDVIQGDFINFYMTLDLSLGTLDRNFLSGTPLQGKLGDVEKALAAGMGLAGQASDPLTAPVAPNGVPGVSAPVLPQLGTSPVPPQQQGTEPPPLPPAGTPPPTQAPDKGLVGGILGGS